MKNPPKNAVYFFPYLIVGEFDLDFEFFYQSILYFIQFGVYFEQETASKFLISLFYSFSKFDFIRIHNDEINSIDNYRKPENFNKSLKILIEIFEYINKIDDFTKLLKESTSNKPCILYIKQHFKIINNEQEKIIISNIIKYHEFIEISISTLLQLPHNIVHFWIALFLMQIPSVSVQQDSLNLVKKCFETSSNFYQNFILSTLQNNKFKEIVMEKVKMPSKNDVSFVSLFWKMAFYKMRGNINDTYTMIEYYKLILETQEITSNDAISYLIVLLSFSQEDISKYISKFGNNLVELILNSSTKNECISFLVASMKNANAYPQINRIVDVLIEICNFDISAISYVKEQISKSVLSCLLKETNMKLCVQFTKLLELVSKAENANENNENEVEEMTEFKINEETTFEIIKLIADYFVFE